MGRWLGGPMINYPKWVDKGNNLPILGKIEMSTVMENQENCINIWLIVCKQFRVCSRNMRTLYVRADPAEFLKLSRNRQRYNLSYSSTYFTWIHCPNFRHILLRQQLKHMCIASVAPSTDPRIPRGSITSIGYCQPFTVKHPSTCIVGNCVMQLRCCNNSMTILVQVPEL